MSVKIKNGNGEWVAAEVASPVEVTTFNGRSGAVVPQAGDYTPDMVGVHVSGEEPTDSNATIWIDTSEDDSVLYYEKAEADAKFATQAAMDALTAADVGAVSKAGDTITGALEFNVGGGVAIQARNTNAGRDAYLQNVGIFALCNRALNDNNNSVSLYIHPQTAASLLQLVTMIEGKKATYDILHTGNKPSGSYTGNGSGTLREIDIGGVGEHLIIISKNGLAVAVPDNTLIIGTDGITFTSYAEFKNGKLRIAATNAVVNANGVNYTYFVS